MVSIRDREIMRSLAEKARTIAQLPEMAERKKRWISFNALKPERPMILCNPEGAWIELLPEKELLCEDEQLRQWEGQLRSSIYQWEHLRDDKIIEPWFDINRSVEISGYGVESRIEQGEGRGSYKLDHPIKDIVKDFDKLRYRNLCFNREKTDRDLSLAGEIFGDILPVRIRGSFWWTLGLTYEAIKLIGLENLMLYMYDEPENLHRLMAWLRDENSNYISWIEENGLLSLNNGNDCIASGGLGYSDELPGREWEEGDKVLLKDLWGFAESQETVGISPAMFAEFILPYQMPLLEKFGLNCYGCCEAIHERWKYISTIPRLRRISISPWCNQEIMANALGKNYIFSRKPHPTLVCTGFDEDAIRKDLRNTLDLTKGCVVEIIMKDTHTVQNEPWRLTEWVRIALEEVSR